MNHQPTKEKRVFSIDPCTRGFGFAILEGPEKLIDWGVKEARTNKNEESLRLIRQLLTRYEPDVIVVEDYARKGSRRCRRVQDLIEGITKLAAEAKIKTRSVSHAEVNMAFASQGAVTKYQIATAIAQKCAEVGPRLPPVRKPWMPEDYRMPIFDATALALTFFHLENKRKKAA
jgi:Holliday junction resolvasome RuvABC endonuclease subunit